MTATDRLEPAMTPARMAALLNALRAEAGGPSNHDLHRVSKKTGPLCAATTISENLRKTDSLQSWRFIEAFVLACRQYALEQASELADPAQYDLHLWKARYKEMHNQQEPKQPHDAPDAGPASATRQQEAVQYNTTIHGEVNGLVQGHSHEVTMNFGPLAPTANAAQNGPSDTPAGGD